MVAESIKTSRAAMIEESIQRWGPKVQGKVIVVTGGARGLGQGMVEGFLRAGAKVVVADKTWVGEEDFKKTLESSGNLALDMDITNDAQLDAAYDAVMSHFGTADVLINNAAIVTETQFPPLGHVTVLETTDRDWQLAFDINLFGLLKATRRFLRPMLEKGRGNVITVVSSGILHLSQGSGWFSFRPGREMPYQATKAAASTLSYYLAAELRDQGIVVNQLMPGHTRGSWFDARARATANIAERPGGRPGIPQHIIPLILFLASQDTPAEGGVTGLLYNTPDWNWENGYGSYDHWLDFDMPDDLEEQYRQSDARLAEVTSRPMLAFNTPATRR